MRMYLALALLLAGFPAWSEPTAQEGAAILTSMGLTALPGRPGSQDFLLENAATGKPVRLSDFRGKYVLLNFWATWCAPCQEEIPSLDHLTSLLPAEKLVVLAVASGEEKAVVGPWTTKNPHRFTVVPDPDQTASSKYGVRALPTTFLIDPQGRVLGGKSGAFYWDSPAVLEGFGKLLR